MNIYTFSPLMAFQWLKEGIALSKKQFSRLLLCCVLFSLVVNTLTAIPMLSILLMLVSIPLLQMLLFNAGFSIRLRGLLVFEDLKQKLNVSSTWLRLLLATFLNLFIISFIASPMSLAMLESMAEAKPIDIDTTMLVLVSVGLFLYSILSLWIYPLITWETMPIHKAFLTSFKASLHNFIPLAIMIVVISLVGGLGFWLMYALQQSLSPTLLNLFSLLFFSTFVIVIYLSSFCAYMMIFYGEDKQANPSSIQQND